MLAVQRVGYPLESPPTAREEAVAGTFESDPSYVDNYTGGGYDVLTGLFRLMYADRFVDFDYSDVLRQLGPADSAASGPLPATADAAAGSRTVRLDVRFFYRSRQTGLIHPTHASRLTLPRLAAAVDTIEGSRRQRDRDIVFAWVEGAFAAHAVAAATIASSRLAGAVSTLRTGRAARPPRPPRREPVQVRGGTARERRLRTRYRPANDNATAAGPERAAAAGRSGPEPTAAATGRGRIPTGGTTAEAAAETESAAGAAVRSSASGRGPQTRGAFDRTRLGDNPAYPTTYNTARWSRRWRQYRNRPPDAIQTYRREWAQGMRLRGVPLLEAIERIVRAGASPRYPRTWQALNLAYGRAAVRAAFRRLGLLPPRPGR